VISFDYLYRASNEKALRRMGPETYYNGYPSFLIDLLIISRTVKTVLSPRKVHVKRWEIHEQPSTAFISGQNQPAH
jgi:hypothetical protein